MSHQALFTHRAIAAVQAFPLIAVTDGDFVWDKKITLPDITAYVSVVDGVVQASFAVAKTNHTKDMFAAVLDSESVKQLTMHRADFLWEKDCFECFIGHADTPAYLEINANSAGQFNSYQFDGYRTPNVMPPVASHEYDVQSFVYQDEMNYCFGFEVTKISTSMDVSRLKINPTVILYPVIDGQAVPIYYAYQHAVPPDFHASDVWQSL